MNKLPAFLHAALEASWRHGILGIVEDGAQMKARLRHIVAFRPQRRAATAGGIALFAVLAALVLTAAVAQVETLRDWSVISVAIPKDGELKDAYVELKLPTGRTVTLTKGVITRDGVTLEKLEWSGTPIRAAVTLRKGDERAELFADAALISQNDALSKRVPQVEIEAKFIELADELAKEIPLLSPQPAATAADGALNAPFGRIAGVITAEQCEVFLRTLNEKKGVDLISAPRVTSRSQQRAVIEIIREFRYPTAWDPPNAINPHWTPNTFETRNVGLTLGVEAKLAEDETIDLHLSPELVEFLGFIDHVTRKPLAKAKHGAGTPFIDRALQPGTEPNAKLSDRTEPVFHTRKVTTSVSIYAGSSVVLILGDADPGEGEKEPPPFPKLSVGKTVIAVITARRMEPRAAPKSAAVAPEPATTLPDRETPLAMAVPNKPGFVTSPHAPQAGYIDVRGFPAGTEVKCPYSGKMFLVPEPNPPGKSGAFSPAPFHLERPQSLPVVNSATGEIGSAFGIRLPLPVGPVRIDYGAALVAGARGSVPAWWRQLDSPGPGYREQVLKK